MNCLSRKSLQASKLRLSLAMIVPALLVLVGCKTPVTQYYVLNTVPAKQAIKSAAPVPAITLRQVEIPRYLDRPRMVSRDAENHLHISEYHQWGGRLRDNLANTLSDNLAERVGSVTVTTAPFPGSMDAEISLLVDFRQFERLADGYMHLRVRWLLQRSGKIIESHYEQLQSDAVIVESDYADMAAAMSQLLGRLADKVAMSILNLPPREKE